MTVAEAKQKLAQFPDDMEILDEYGEGGISDLFLKTSWEPARGNFDHVAFTTL